MCVFVCVCWKGTEKFALSKASYFVLYLVRMIISKIMRWTESKTLIREIGRIWRILALRERIKSMERRKQIRRLVLILKLKKWTRRLEIDWISSGTACSLGVYFEHCNNTKLELLILPVTQKESSSLCAGWLVGWLVGLFG